MRTERISERLLSLPQASDRLGISHWTLRKWAASGRIDSVKLGRRRLIPEKTVESIIVNGLSSACARRTTSHDHRGECSARRNHEGGE